MESLRREKIAVQDQMIVMEDNNGGRKVDKGEKEKLIVPVRYHTGHL